jgi:hypothetical protein
MTEPVDGIAAGRAAWERIKGRDRATWGDWIDVARSLAIGRAETMKAANTNRPVGTTYNRLMGQWLKQHSLDDVGTQERYRALLILENLAEIETWRAGLDEAKRRAWNHPNSVWSHFRRRKQETDRAAPACKNFVKASMQSHKNGARPLYWPQHCVRAAHEAMLKSRSHDLLVLARVALEAAIPSADVLIDLLNEAKQQPHPARASAAAAVVHAA